MKQQLPKPVEREITQSKTPPKQSHTVRNATGTIKCVIPNCLEL